MGKLKNQYLLTEDLALSPLQLGELIGQPACVEAWCNRCGHLQMLDAEHLVKRLGPQVRVPEIGVHMECECCSSKDIAARPVWMEPVMPMVMAAE